MNKRIFKICKSIIEVTLTLSFLIYFGYVSVFLPYAYEEKPQESVQNTLATPTENTNELVTSQENSAVVANETISSVSSNDIYSQVTISEDTEKFVNTSRNKGTVVATITYSYQAEITEPAESELDGTVSSNDISGNEGQIEPVSTIQTFTHIQEFYSLQEAFSGAANAKAEMDSYGYTGYIPVIQINEDITVPSTTTNTDNTNFVLDLNSHWIDLNQNAYLDFGEGSITITDQNFIDNGSTDTVPLGKITGNAGYLFTGTNDLILQTGYYQNTSDGYLINEAGAVTFENGYFFTEDGQIVNSVMYDTNPITVHGGFFTYDPLQGFCNVGTLFKEEGKQLVETELEVAGSKITGYCVGIPDYKVAILLNEIEMDIYYSDFSKAWERAVEFSKAKEETEVGIELCNLEVTSVNLSQSYTMDADVDGGIASIHLSNMNFKRQEGYDENFFRVTAGKLSFSNCQLDGYLGENEVSQGALVSVTDQGTLYLENTTIQNNRSIEDVLLQQPGAGVYLGEKTSLEVLGEVKVMNNSYYIPETSDDAAMTMKQNIYMESDAQIIVAGALSGNTGEIGITYPDENMSEKIVLGRYDTEYLSSISEQTDEEALSIFTIDKFPSFWIMYNAEENQLYWSRRIMLLPEAGLFRFEIVILFIGLMVFILCNIPAIKRRRELEILMKIFAITCLVSGIFIGVLNIKREEKISNENTQILTEMTANQEKVALAENTREIEALEETMETKETEENMLLVPDDGREYYGIVEVPEYGIKLPILMEYTDANMKTTPCVYYGSIANRNLVVVGHNYDSQFGELNHAGEGITVRISLTDGTSYEYISTLAEYYNPDCVDEVLTGNWDLTLLTCNYAGDKRIALRCNIVK